MDHDLLSIADARERLRRARTAFEAFRRFEQPVVDRITFAVVEAGYASAASLARAAVEETGIGHVPGKTAKNRFATRGLWRGIREMRTCGILREDDDRGVWEVADPFGVVAAIIPTTNPTSTALYKAIICLKSRNAMVASPHPRARGCIRESLRIAAEAAEAAGAPPGILQCMEAVSLEGTRELMQHRETDLILATGGSALVRAAYSSGKPAFGVGPGNVPVYVHASADIPHAARCLIESQTFDNGTICSSEQAVIADREIASSLREALVAGGARFLDAEETGLVERVAIKGGVTNPDIVGLSAARVARAAGFEVPEETAVLIAPYGPEQVGREHPLSLEKLCPLLAFYEVDGWEAGCELALSILALGGRGHTLGLHCEDREVIRRFAVEKPANRIVVNSPTTQGAVGYSTGLFPSMTLGCGSFGGNITSDNIGPQHLLNIKRVGFVTPAWRSGAREEFAESLPPLSGGVGVPAPAAWPADRLRPARPAAPAPRPRREPETPRGGAPGGRLPGEHFSAAELERIIHDAISRRRETLDREDGRSGDGR